MIFYAPDPMDLPWQYAQEPTFMIPLASGGHVVAQNMANNRIRIVAVNSTDPVEFLDKRYQPGNVLVMTAQGAVLE